jgi:hypothetical protein
MGVLAFGHGEDELLRAPHAGQAGSIGRTAWTS